MKTEIYQTINDADWQWSLIRARAEGNEILRRIRAATAAQETFPCRPKKYVEEVATSRETHP